MDRVIFNFIASVKFSVLNSCFEFAFYQLMVIAVNSVFSLDTAVTF